jgi:hypothetical protein
MSHVMSPGYDTAGYLKGLHLISHLMEPAPIRDGRGKVIGYEPHNANSHLDDMRHPLPAHFHFETLLKNLHSSPGIELDLSRSEDPEYDKMVWDSIPTSKFGLDTSPINFAASSTHGGYMWRDQQHLINGLESGDPLLSHVLHRYYRPSKSHQLGHDFSGFAPRASLALGNHAWDTGANDHIVNILKKHFVMLDRPDVDRIENILPKGGLADATARERVNRLLRGDTTGLARGTYGLNNIDVGVNNDPLATYKPGYF